MKLTWKLQKQENSLNPPKNQASSQPLKSVQPAGNAEEEVVEEEEEEMCVLAASTCYDGGERDRRYRSPRKLWICKEPEGLTRTLWTMLRCLQKKEQEEGF